MNTPSMHSFLDYIQGGCEISLIVGIDFTKSNIKPGEPLSLHSLNFEQNQYLEVIEKIGPVVECYDTDKKIPVFGFGAKLPGMKEQVSHCFALNGNIHDPELNGIKGVVDCYKKNIQKLEFQAPTNFAEIIELAADFARSTKVQKYKHKYFILLMITDGQISDMKQTIDQIVGASSLPLSIIIVGVGGQSFQTMKILDADAKPLYSEKLKKQMERDIVQFVPFRKFKNKPDQLAFQTLRQIPRQIVSFFETNGIAPVKQLKGNPRRDDDGLEIPSFFIQRKLDFAQFLCRRNLDPKSVQTLLNQGIPCEKVEYVELNINKQENENSLLLMDHSHQARHNERYYLHKLNGLQPRQQRIQNTRHVDLSIPSEPAAEGRREIPNET